MNVFLALDSDIDHCLDLLGRTRSCLAGVKIGMEFFYRYGRDGYQKVQDFGLPIFLDLKIHDIPNTTYRAILALAGLKPNYLTVHASADVEALRLAKIAGYEIGTTMVAVTQLTSSNVDIGMTALVQKCLDCGIGSVVCSGQDNQIVRSLSKDLVIFNPGIRLDDHALNDQVRTVTPKEASETGGNFIIIGRPILLSSDPENEIKKYL